MKPLCKQCERRDAVINCVACSVQLCADPECSEACYGDQAHRLCLPCACADDLCPSCLLELYERMGRAA